VSIQLGHCGGFSKHKNPSGRAPAGPSAAWNAYGLMYGVPRIRAMDNDDLEMIVRDFSLAAKRVQEAGFDALEVHCGHGYLLSQFLSPAINRRKDEWGGSLQARLRLPLKVISAIREVVGPQFPILAKVNTSDAVRGGLTISEAVEICTHLVRAGVDALVPSGGLVSKSPFYLLRGQVPVREMIAAEKHPAQRLAIRLFAPLLMQSFEYRPNFFLEDALKIVRAVDVPVALLGGVDSVDAVQEAMDSGFEFVALGRALLADPDFILRMEAGENFSSRCTHCNACIGEMDRGGVRCVLDD
jgi:2,4-dienoyl-CoA reductase-like NADH-dependent reductase (Old Yellow Enzyme family)